MSGRHFFEHDERGPSTSKPSYQRENFVMGRHKEKKYYRNSGGKSRMFDLEPADVEMAGNNHVIYDRRFNPYSQNNKNNRRKGKKNGKHKHNRGNSEYGSHTWYKVTIPHGKKLGKEFIVKSINSLMKTAFKPYNFQFNKGSAEFYISDDLTYTQIKEIHRRITTPDGFKMHLIINPVNSPVPPTIDSQVTDIIKNAMSSCYDPERRSLNLMKFSELDSFKTHGLHVPLNKSAVFQTVMKIIKENIPELEILILTSNKLYGLEAASTLVPACKQLKFINLHSNKIRSVIELNHLKGLDLEELVLDGNPLCDDFKDKTSYISAVRERFSKLKRLDGHDLPPTIGFDLGSETLPASKKSFLAAPDVKDMVIQFLDAYYSVYDSGERMRLLDAYHDQAAFSLHLSKHTQKTQQGSLAVYTQENRNLLRVIDSNERFKLLKQGKLSVVNALQELPQTMHDPSSFSIDIFHVSPGLMGFSVLGVFKEVGADINNVTLKTFSRTFIVVPNGTGFVIVNETLFIAHASTDQQAKAFKLPAPTPSPSPAPPIEEKSTAEKQMMVIELHKQTGMNLGFSSKCLEENDWDYQKAVAVFMKFQSEGKLPPEAFLQT